MSFVWFTKETGVLTMRMWSYTGRLTKGERANGVKATKHVYLSEEIPCKP